MGSSSKLPIILDEEDVILLNQNGFFIDIESDSISRFV